MTFLGFISLLQIIILPGLIFTAVFPVRGRLTRIIFSFALSLIFNYQLVWLLTLLHLYTRTAVWVVLVLEIGFFVFYYIKKSRSVIFIKEPVRNDPDNSNSFLQLTASTQRILKFVSAGTGMLIIFGFLFKIREENPGIFDSWDDVVSWNHWASEWYAGDLPRYTYHYPQLLPANWSLSYQFLGTDDIQIFAKSIMGLFGLGILFIFWDLYKKSKSLYFLLALTISGFIIQRTVGAYLGKGYADIPVAFFGLCVFYVSYLAINGYLSVPMGLIMSTLMLSGAMLTKQAGFFMIALFLTGVYFLLKKSVEPVKKKWWLMGASIGILLLSVAPWYIYKQVQINRGKERSEITYVTKDIYAGKTKIQRMMDASEHFSNKVVDFEFLKFFSDPGKKSFIESISIFVFLLMLLSLFSFYGRMCTLLVVLPYYIIWACFFSYDLRNISLLLPFLGLSISIGLVVCIKYVSGFIIYLQHTNRLTLAGGILTLLLVVGLSLNYGKASLLNYEFGKARTVLGDSTLNNKLYELKDSNQIRGKIVSGFALIKYLPLFKQHVQDFTFTKEHLDSLKNMAVQNETDHQIQYLIFNDAAPVEIMDFIHQKEQEGAWKFIFRSDAGWHIEEILNQKNK
jgi:hypothetical protein